MHRALMAAAIPAAPLAVTVAGLLVTLAVTSVVTMRLEVTAVIPAVTEVILEATTVEAKKRFSLTRPDGFTTMDGRDMEGGERIIGWTKEDNFCHHTEF